MATSPGTPAFHPPIGSVPDPDLLIAEAHLRARRRRLRHAATGAAALAVIAAMYALSGGPSAPRGDGAQAGIGTEQTSASLNVARAAFGNRKPVEIDGMTFLVDRLAVAPPIRLVGDQPLQAKQGERFWLLTVSVRNDSPVVEADPFCRPKRANARNGSELLTNQTGRFADAGSVQRWRKQSWLIVGNPLCGVIQPGAVETYQLLYRFPRGRKVAGLVLNHRAPGSKRSTFAFVPRDPGEETRIVTYR